MLNQTAPYLEINLLSLENNLNELLSLGYTSDEIIAVVKDNAYGCGAVKISQKLESLGVNRFAVARMHEAIELRKAKILGDIIVFGECTELEISHASENNISLAINDLRSLQIMGNSNLPLKIHLNIDSGMGRFGIVESEIDLCIKLFFKYPNLQKSGIFTHLANSDIPNFDSVKKHIESFMNIKNIFNNSNITFENFHISNSAGIINYKKINGALVRPGIALYGSKPNPSKSISINLQNILSLIAPVVKIKRVSAGTPISYGSNYIAKKETNIATLSAGYAHGFLRSAGVGLEIYIGDKKFPIAGNVTMDCIMVDIGKESGIKVGDEALLAGSRNGKSVSIDHLATRSDTISYELLCSLGRCKERLFVG